MRQTDAKGRIRHEFQTNFDNCIFDGIYCSRCSGRWRPHTEGHETDITDAVLVNRSADCADYVGAYSAVAQDLQNETEFVSSIVITATEDSCTVTSNSVPNHAFNDETAAFAGGTEGATISEVETISTFARYPEFADTPTVISQQV